MLQCFMGRTSLLLTDRCNKITFPQPSGAGGKKNLHKFLCFFSAITCEDPGDVPNARKVPGKGPYTCGSHVTYVCHHGYELRGNASLYCHRDGKFAGSVPHCQGTRKYTSHSRICDAARRRSMLFWTVLTSLDQKFFFFYVLQQTFRLSFPLHRSQKERVSIKCSFLLIFLVPFSAHFWQTIDSRK